MKRKHILSLALMLALVLVLTMLPIRAEAATVASGKCGDNLTWVLDDRGTLTISGTGSMGNNIPWRDYAKNIKKVIMKDGVTTIGDDAFYSCDSLTGVTIPDSVTTIGDYAFAWCTSLTGVTIPDSVTTIGDYAFRSCESLTSVSIPSSVTNIGKSAFLGCTSLTSITIPASVTEIGNLAFYGCSNLTGFRVDVDNPNYSSDDRGVLFNKDKTTLVQVPGAISGSYTIPSSITTIPGLAFENCVKLQSITIPASVRVIDNAAFAGCTKLKEIVFQGKAPQIFLDFIDMGYGTLFPLTRVFEGVEAIAYYPQGDASWTADVLQDYKGNITWKSYNAKIVPTKPYKIANVVSGVHVYWKAVPGITKYGLFRSETGKNGTYKWIGNPAATHHIDMNVESGKTYYYKVASLDNAGNFSFKSEAMGITFVNTPDITNRFNKPDGVSLSWSKSWGATGYAIYRKPYSGNSDWKRVATISGNTTFTWIDTSVKDSNGVAYKYTVRALAGSDMKTLSGCRNAGRSMVRLTPRVLTSAEKKSVNSIKCTWTTSSAVTGYEIRFMVRDEIYKTFTIGNYKTGAKTFGDLPTGVTYKIQVRSYVKIDGMGFYSPWSAGKKVYMP